MESIIKLENVDQYNSLYGLETLHPLISVIDLTKATKIVNHIQMNYGLYALFLKQTKSCNIKYGRTSYDYEEGTIVCFAPGQTAGVDLIEDEVAPKVYGIIFHPDLIRGTSLGKSIKTYTFFSYAVNEALHLSKQEQQTVIDCLTKIDEETYDKADRHSNLIIASAIELLLNYCIRFYDRQFITRTKENKDTLGSFEALLNDYFTSDKPSKFGTPTVAYCADQLHLSANYFGDLIKKETGLSAQEYILAKTMDTAKELLADPTKSVSDVAYALGYQYPQYFSKAFKRVVGCSPNEYRTFN